MIFETDTNRVLVWDNAAWVMIADTDEPPALQLVASGSATSGSSVSINNCFTTDYDTYLIILEDVRTTTAQGWTFRLRAAGTDTAGTNYYNVRRGYIYTSDTPQIQRVDAGANIDLPCISDTNSASCVIHVSQPKKARVTDVSAKGLDSRTGGYGLFDSGGILNDTTQYDGFSVLNAGTIVNINVTVYGYRK
jgi:hypothetical protein